MLPFCSWLLPMLPTISTVPHCLENKKPVLQRLNETVVSISIKKQVHTVYLPPGTSWETLSVGGNNNKGKA